jgi:methylmalonyl-CoA/ethylmalonyl-CoA epimerase
MELKQITEIGVAVRDLEKTTRVLVEAFQGQAGAVYDVPLFGMRFRMVRIGNIDIELMEPTSEKGIIAKFLDVRGEGMHHVAFAVENLETQVEEMKNAGYVLVNEKPLEIFDAKVTFLHPKSFSGLAIELVEYPSGWKGWFTDDMMKEGGAL